MKRFTVLLVLLAMLLAPVPALAHDSSWDPGPSKADGLSPGIACKAVGSYQGHSYTWTYAMVGDPSQPADSERAWLAGFCDHAGRESVKGFFRWTEGLDIPDSAIKITFAHQG